MNVARNPLGMLLRSCCTLAPLVLMVGKKKMYSITSSTAPTAQAMEERRWSAISRRTTSRCIVGHGAVVVAEDFVEVDLGAVEGVHVELCGRLDHGVEVAAHGERQRRAGGGDL